MKLLKKITSFFDRTEDKIRSRLSHMPIVYAMVGALGIVLVWKGVWETAELFPALHGPGSVLLGVVILLMSGLLVSFFIGDNIIISGFKKEKKLVEKTEGEIRTEQEEIKVIEQKIDRLEQEVQELVGR